jgi:hypothetical protein
MSDQSKSESVKDARWRTRTTRAVKNWWTRSGWKTTAIISVPLGIVFGAVGAIQRVELQDHHLHIDPTGPNWADIVTALSTLLLAVGALLALLAILEARRARHAETITEAARRWDERTFRHVRARVKGIIDERSEEGLKKMMLELRKANSTDYFELMAIPDYFEDLAIMMTYRAVTFRMVDDSLGVTVAKYWKNFSPFITELREVIDDRHAYENFQKLGQKIQELHPQSDVEDVSKTSNEPAPEPTRRLVRGRIGLSWTVTAIEPSHHEHALQLAERISTRRGRRRRVLSVSISLTPL